MGLVKRKIVFFYDFLPGSTTFVLWRTAKTWMQPSTKTKDTFEPSNETVFDEKTVHGRKQMYKWECKAVRKAFLGTTSQALRASSPGRGAIGRPGQPCCSHRPNRAQSTGPCPNGQQLRNCALTKDAGQAAVNLDSGARSFPDAKNFARSVRPSPTRQGLPYQGSWHRKAMTERLYYMPRFRFVTRLPEGDPSYNLSVTFGDTSPCRRGLGIP